MPAGHNKVDKYINNIKVDKENSVCFFNDENHVYYNKETMQTYISCTTLVHSYSQPFDEDFWSSYKALEALLEPDLFTIVKPKLLSTKRFNKALVAKLELNEDDFDKKKNEILNEYALKRKTACDKGTLAHAKKEMSFYNNTDFDFSKYGYKELCGKFVCEENHSELDLQNGVYPEFLIQWESEDKTLRIAGISDLVILKDNELYIIDWKTSKTIDKKSYYNKQTKQSVKMKYPLNALDDCNFNVYQLQLSLYAWMIKQTKPDIVVKGLTIVQLLDDGGEVSYPSEYLEHEVERMIAHYMKQQKINKELDRDKPIDI